MAKKYKQKDESGFYKQGFWILAGILITMIGIFYADIKSDIQDNADLLKQTQSDLTAMRIEFVRFHPEIGRAAYAVSANASDLNTSQARDVFEILANSKYSTGPTDTALAAIQADLKAVNSLPAITVQEISNAYFSIDPVHTDNWTQDEIALMLDGLKRSASISPEQVDFMAAKLPPSRGIMDYFSSAGLFVVAFVTLVLLVSIVFSFWSDRRTTNDDTS